jgi:hypothetical protein
MADDDKPPTLPLLPSAYDLLSWLDKEQDYLSAHPGLDDGLHRSLVEVTAHIAASYWADPNDEGLKQRPDALPGYHQRAAGKARHA